LYIIAKIFISINTAFCEGTSAGSMPVSHCIKSCRRWQLPRPTQDYRFKPVEEGEVKDLKIEISVLTPMRKISSIDEFQLGKHGIYIRKGIPFGDISSAGRTGDWMDEGRVSRPLCTG